MSWGFAERLIGEKDSYLNEKKAIFYAFPLACWIEWIY